MKNSLLITLACLLTTSVLAQSSINMAEMRARFEARRPGLDTMSATPTNFDLEFSEFVTMTSDSIRIHSWFIPHAAAKGTLLMVHGFNMNKSHMLSRAIFFHKQGYSVVLSDLRARGLSGGQKATTGEANGLDVQSVSRYYQKELAMYGPLNLYGFSHGGRAVIFGASKTGLVSSIILESPPYFLGNSFKRQYGFPSPMPMDETALNNSLDHIKDISVLLMIGDNDTAIIPEEAKQLLTHNSNSSSQLVTFEATEHHIFTEKNQAQFQQVTTTFLTNKD